MKTRRGPAGRGPSRKSRSFSRPILERVEDRVLMTVFTVNNTADSGAGSLRQAIIDSNGSTAALPNAIDFSLPAGLQTFMVGSTSKTALPAITQPVVIDGTTAMGYDPANPVPTIEINGSSKNLPTGNPGFAVNSPTVTLKALIIDGFQGLDAGVVLNGGTDSVQGCWIGLDPTGTKSPGNGGEGITVSSPNNTIGGTTPAARNVVTGNFTEIHVTGGGATGNLIEGNFIGTDASGLVAPNNLSFDGIDINTANNTIGGSSSLANGILSGAGNVITSGFAAISISNTGSNNNVIQGNFLGTDATGMKLAVNAAGTGTKRTFVDGIDVSSVSNTRIGGPTPDLKNVISGNGGYGIQVSTSNSPNTRIQGNYIGVGVDGVTPLGNQSSGVFINGANNVLVGGTVLGGSAPNLGNIIAYNGGGPVALQKDGVTIQGGQNDGILTNRIFSNVGLGIKLSSGNQGVQPPTLTSVQSGGAQTRIIGSYFGLPNTPYRIQFFSNQTPDPSGAGQGMNFVGDLDITTDNAGNVNFSTVLNQGVPIGQYVSATATQQVLVINNTSQFSTDIQATLAQVTDLAVSTMVSATPPLLNQNYTYAVTVTNNGPQDATGVILTDTIPTNSTFVSTDGGQFSAGVVTDDIGALASGASVTVHIIVKPTSVAGSLTNTATVTGDQLDTSLTNNTSVTTGTVQSNADLSVNLTANPNPAPIGSTVTYTLLVSNNGPSTTSSTVVTVDLPPTLSNVVVTPDQGSAAVTGNTVTITLGILPANSSSTTTIVGTPTAVGTITVTATVSSELVDPNMANNTTSLDVQVANAADLSVQMSALPDPVLIGQELIYTIPVTNIGPSQASSPVLVDTLPAGVNYVPVDSNAGGNGTLSFANGVVTATLSPLPAGGTYTVTIAVIATASGRILNTATVADPDTTNPAEIDPDLSNNTATLTTLVSPADLGVTVENPPDPLVVGTPAVFQILITNDGPADANNVILNDVFSAIGTILSSSAGTPVGGTLNVNLGTLASGGSTTVTITVNPTASGTLVDSATVSSDEVDPNPNNNTSSSSNLVSPVDLAVGVTASPNPVLVGGQVAFVVTVTNNGPTTADNVIFRDILPPSATLNSATTSQGSVFGNPDNTVTGNLGSIAPGGSATVTILVTTNTVSTATDSASVTSDGFDTNPANNTGSASVSVINLPGTIEVGTPLVFVGENAGFATITLDRVNGTLGTVTVNYATADYTAIAGVHYVASSGVVSFADGQTTATLQIPVLDDFKVDGSHGFFVNFSNPTGGAALSPNNVAAVVVTNTDRDMISPSVSGLIGIPNGQALNGFYVFFNKAMDPTRASLVSNYHVYLSNSDGGFGETPVTLAAALYDPASDSVRLIPTTPLPSNRFYHIILNGSYGPALTDVSGNPLAGVSGRNTNYDIYYGQGTSLRYIDSQANSVTVTLTGGGTMGIFRGLNGDAAALDLYGVVPHKSKLSGGVKKLNRQSSGHTSINSISGLGQFGDVHSNLTTPAFYVISAPVGVTSLKGPTTVTAASRTPVTTGVAVPIPLVTTGKQAPKGTAVKH